MRFTGWAANYVDERTSISGAVRELGRKIFPDHWSFMLGEVALYSFVVILLYTRSSAAADVSAFCPSVLHSSRTSRLPG